MSEFGKLTFESVFCGSDAPLKPSHITNETNNKSSKSKDDLDSFLKKTPLMILEEIAKGILQQTPSWSSAEISGTAPIEFEMTLSFNGKTLKARGNSKKSAKQKVALEFLHLAVNDGRRVEFFIPGETDEDAHINIDRISERAEDIKRPNPVAPKDLDRSIPTVREFPEGVPDKNWVGALQERCQKLKLEAPCYEDVRIESSCEFIVTCTMRNQKTRGVKSKVKAAKNLAAWLMLKSLEEGPGAVQSFDDLFSAEDLEEMEREENLAKYRQGVFDMKDAKAALIDVLSDKKDSQTTSWNSNTPV
uniref:DRBM domain-containing protein n=1 Tax=Caenorhabditis tropicalis TaxID=1561998 RepID=A0A1I7TNJ4_9PELO